MSAQDQNHTSFSIGDDQDEEAAVVQYLIDNPDVFTRHVNVLEQLQLPADADGRVVSLAGRQTEVLRDKLKTQDAELELLMLTAERNSAVQQSLNEFVIELLTFQNARDALSAIPSSLNKHFDLAVSAIRLPDAVLSEISGLKNAADYGLTNSKQSSRLVDRVSHGNSVCDDRLPNASLNYLFGEKADVVGSCALLPVALQFAGQTQTGLAALGAEDSVRFHPAQGTHFLDTLAQMISTTLNRCLSDG